MTKININDIVRVKLTKKGYSIYNTYTITNYLINKVNKNGLKDDILETELWEIMQIFGDYFYVGAEALFENNEISIVDLP